MTRTMINLSNSTVKKLKLLGRKGETYDDILKRLIKPKCDFLRHKEILLLGIDKCPNCKAWLTFQENGKV